MRYEYPLKPPKEIPVTAATLRDQFAMAALTGMLTSYGEYQTAEVVAYAYELADAMLAERGK